MKIGLVRHFKVKKEYPFLLSANELSQWFAEYDEADIELGDFKYDVVRWDRCFTSDLPRAANTARVIFRGPITEKKELREIPIPLIKGNIKLPFILWALIIRTLPIFNRRIVVESRKDVQKRVETILDEILLKDKNTLIVSHGLLMLAIRKCLIKKGFKGPRLGNIANGKLYTFEPGKIIEEEDDSNEEQRRC
ncbi:histidine phosphatase family protein [Paenibacillus wynnii]|uniref:histidine phosphatase family protein n=1 Tax=Paenibacillus wynnii TaxID=268407 RepID=UPI0006924CFA|nr:histidine phosphatase family protein [Paenibacillus wynnii]